MCNSLWCMLVRSYIYIFFGNNKQHKCESEIHEVSVAWIATYKVIFQPQSTYSFLISPRKGIFWVTHNTCFREEISKSLCYVKSFLELGPWKPQTYITFIQIYRKFHLTTFLMISDTWSASARCVWCQSTTSRKHAYIILTPLNPTFKKLNWGIQYSSLTWAQSAQGELLGSVNVRRPSCVVRRSSCGVNNCFKSLLLLHP